MASTAQHGTSKGTGRLERAFTLGADVGGCAVSGHSGVLTPSVEATLIASVWIRRNGERVDQAAQLSSGLPELGNLLVASVWDRLQSWQRDGTAPLKAVGLLNMYFISARPSRYAVADRCR